MKMTIKPALRMSALALAVGVVGMTQSNEVQACSCISSASSGAVEISGVVASGSAAIVTALQLGFDNTSTMVNTTNADSAKRIVDAITGMTTAISNELIRQPAVEAAVTQEVNAMNPARHATNECEYLQRSSDSTAADAILGAQQDALNESVIAYNEIPSSYNEAIDPESAFKAQTNQLFNTTPGVKTAAIKVITGPDDVGAMTPEDFADASRALNLTLNPSPPAKFQSPSTPSQINNNVDAELFNMRMQLPQGISQAILAYEAPLLNLPDDSWYSTMLERMSPQDYEEFTQSNKQVSKSDLLKHMATHRMKDPVTVANAATKDETGLKKDLALVKADHLVMDYELWLQDRYQSLLLSQIAASQVRKERK